MNPNKIDAKLLEALTTRTQVASLTDETVPMFRVIVRFSEGSVTAAEEFSDDIAIHAHHPLIRAVTLSGTREAIEKLSDQRHVRMIELDARKHTMLDQSMPLVQAPAVWQAGDTAKGVKVAVIDTGIDLTHPDFEGRVSKSRDFTGDGVQDGFGHGTHVAGIIGGDGRIYRGAAYDCEFLIAKALANDGGGYDSWIIGAIEWAIAQGAQVINMSLGADVPGDGTDALSEACDAAVDQGVVVVVAAGNSGPSAGTVGSPGCAKKVITVGASDKGDRMAPFSSRGPTLDQRVKPEVTAPGMNIAAPRAAKTTMGAPINSLYTRASGTSMATPHVAGLVALLLKAKPELSAGQIKDILMGSTKDLGEPPNTQGTGRIDALAAYGQAIATTPAPEPAPVPAFPPFPSTVTVWSIVRWLIAVLWWLIFKFKKTAK